MNARTVAFVLASTSQGTLIVNRFDHYRSERAEWGVGFELLRDGSYSSKEVNLCLALLKHRRQHFGDGVFAVDCGANLGIHTIEWARFMSGWGSVLAVEPQSASSMRFAATLHLTIALTHELFTLLSVQQRVKFRCQYLTI